MQMISAYKSARDSPSIGKSDDSFQVSFCFQKKVGTIKPPCWLFP